ncbi:hypothetical protein N1851_029387 [Merluccius polli]|uniref:DDE Tnp4 domain-containing protein n=1 Tax=Merluccius polli TaxID=89951 RepID=A0AA47NQT3_MERPO|nr:hypothetical protein N1851_029387 [Merluccius polli]
MSNHGTQDKPAINTHTSFGTELIPWRCQRIVFMRDTAFRQHKRSRKGFINLQMTCDHQLMVTSVDVKWPGSVHHSWIFRESTLCQQFLQGAAQYTRSLTVNVDEVTDHIMFFLIGRYDGVIVGDRGYACMTPYGDPQTPSEARFNRAPQVCGGRRGPGQIITACVVLHNIATIRKGRTPHVPLVADDVVDPTTIDHPTGVAVRQAMTTVVFFLVSLHFVEVMDFFFWFNFGVL